jgi:cellulose synthase/poly-beta-1,6-N-acetylglucosamine synthase-like glycosyltransferase
MKRRAPRRPAGILFLAVTSLLGAGFGVLLEAFFWANTYSEPFNDALARIPRQFDDPSPPFLLFAIVGGLFGFAIGAYARRGTELRTIGRSIFTVVLLAAGATIGLFLGVVTYLVLWLQSEPSYGIAEVFQPGSPVLDSGGGPLFALASTGFLIGLAVSAFAIGSDVTRRFARALAGTILGAMSGLIIFGLAYVAINYPHVPDSPSYFLHFGEAINSFSPLEFSLVGFGAFLGLIMSRYSWRFYGMVTLIALVSVVTGFLCYSLFVTLPRVEDPFRPFAILLFVAEAVSLTMVVLYSFYTIDVATRKRWRKSHLYAAHSRYFLPKVAFQVPCFNEPSELVEATLRKLLAMDYPKDRHLIMVLDDSTNEETRAHLAGFCNEHGIQYIHREDRKGYKAGALNHSLQFVPEDVDFLAIIDADYQVEPDYLKETVGFFANPNLAWVQTPQDYRNRHQSFLTEQYYLADSYFYRTVMPSRNEENTIIFCGTMGILRKEALIAVGGWGEKYISEDAELSLRLATAGYESLFINKTYGRGLIPPTFDGYKKQHYRWAFGGAKILKGHFFSIMFGRLSRRQSFDYFVGSAHWFEGLFIVLLSWILFALGMSELLGFPLVTHHSREIVLIGLVPLFLLTDGLTRLHMVMRENMRLSIGQTIRVLGMWFSVKFSNAFGAFKALVGFNIPFVRTPKAPSEKVTRTQALERSFRVAPFESTMAALMFILSAALGYKHWRAFQFTGELPIAKVFLVLWIFYYALIYFAAPLYAYKSYVTFRPDKESEDVPESPGVRVGAVQPGA